MGQSASFWRARLWEARLRQVASLGGIQPRQMGEVSIGEGSIGEAEMQDIAVGDHIVLAL